MYLILVYCAIYFGAIQRRGLRYYYCVFEIENETLLEERLETARGKTRLLLLTFIFQGWGPNDRGVSVTFGEDNVRRFCQE